MMHAVTLAEMERIGAIYGPLAIALGLGVRQSLKRGRHARQFPACLLSMFWAGVSLVVVARLNQGCGWWSFLEGDVFFCGMPLELYFGWALLWGVLPEMAFLRLRLELVAAVMTALDVLAMPLCGAVVRLGPRWLVGEAVAVLVVLLPAIAIARWTREGTHLRGRSAVQVALAGMLFLFVVPEIAFALRPGLHAGWAPLVGMAGWERQLALLAVCALALPGVAAVMEFAERGGGTPIPYDPPKRLVTSGVYRYVANPMQLSCGVVMLAWAAILRNGWLVLPAALAIVYSAGIARWDEREDLFRRFGSGWVRYRASVRDWRPRWRPYCDGPAAQLFLDMHCGACGELQRWLEKRYPLGMVILDAGTLASGSILRLRYDPQDGCATVEGVRALGRALEHLHLGWALAGAALRLPGVWQVVQVVMDASGFGPRVPVARSAVCLSAPERVGLKPE